MSCEEAYGGESFPALCTPLYFRVGSNEGVMLAACESQPVTHRPGAGQSAGTRVVCHMVLVQCHCWRHMHQREMGSVSHAGVDDSVVEGLWMGGVHNDSKLDSVPLCWELHLVCLKCAAFKTTVKEIMHHP